MAKHVCSLLMSVTDVALVSPCEHRAKMRPLPPPPPLPAASETAGKSTSNADISAIVKDGDSTADGGKSGTLHFYFLNL